MYLRLVGLSLLVTLMRDIGTGLCRTRKAKPPTIEEVNREFHRGVMEHLVDISQRLGERRFSIGTIAVLYAVHLHGPLAVDEIAQITKLTPTAVRSCINHLRADNLVWNSSNVAPALYRTTSAGIAMLNRNKALP